MNIKMLMIECFIYSNLSEDKERCIIIVSIVVDLCCKLFTEALKYVDNTHVLSDDDNFFFLTTQDFMI